MIHKLSITLALLALSYFCSGQKATWYGESFEPNPALSVNEVPKKMNDADSLSGTFQGTIETSCQMSGCWMTVKSNVGEVYRITFKDYGFFVPTEGLSGKLATFNGYCLRQTTSVAEQQHYAEDAGKTQQEIAMITAPKDEFSFVAIGVKIED